MVTNPPIFLGEFGLKTLSYHDGRVVVLSEPGLHQLVNGSRKDKNRKKILEAVNRFIYTTKYENNSGLIDIFTFIAKEKLALDLTSDWFQDLWYPLSKSQPIQLDGLKKVNFQPIIVTTNLLNWMGFKGKDNSIKQFNFSKVLRSHEIPYEEIGYDHPLAIEYPCVQQEARLIPSNNLNKFFTKPLGAGHDRRRII